MKASLLLDVAVLRDRTIFINTFTLRGMVTSWKECNMTNKFYIQMLETYCVELDKF